MFRWGSVHDTDDDDDDDDVDEDEVLSLPSLPP